MKKIDPVDVRTLREKLGDSLFKVTSYGSPRREVLVPLLREWQCLHHVGLRVNSRGCPIMTKDSDLQYLVEHNIARLVRIHESHRTSRTYLQLPHIAT